MSLFSQNKDLKVRGLVLKLINNNCPELLPQFEDTRSDNRVKLAVVIMVVPLQDGKIQAEEGFTALTKDFSSLGLSIVIEQPLAAEQAILGFRFDGEVAFVRAEAKHVDPMGGGFFQLGFRLLEVVSAGDYPGLASLKF